MKGDVPAAALRLLNSLPKRTHEFKPYHRDRSKAAMAAKRAMSEAQERARRANGKRMARKKRAQEGFEDDEEDAE